MLIIKIGGGEKININGIIKDLSEINEKFIIVHGANFERDELLKSLKKEKKIITSVSGYSSVFSDKEMIDMIMMSYSGLKNKRIVELCQKHGINAVGLSGIDGQLIKGKRNSGIRVKENEKIKIVRDLSGKPKEINKKLINLLLEENYVPVISIPILDEENFAINSENDDIINSLQETLNAKRVIQLIEARGILKNKDDGDSLIKTLSKKELQELESSFTGRAKRKILAIRMLLEKSPCQIIVTDGRAENPVMNALNEIGTIIK